MYNQELRAISALVSDLFLDPNNPRFWDDRTTSEIPENRITEPEVQAETERRIGSYGIEELEFNILRNGFLPLDRIVVRQISGLPGKYVVIEGNRRLTALRSLHRDIDSNAISEEGIDEEYLSHLYEVTKTIEVLEYIGALDEDITWILQGIRHISGVRHWEPAQRARLVVKMRGESKSYKEIGQKFGISAQAVGRLYRSFKGLEQMQQDDEFGSKVKAEYFSLFEEAYRNIAVRNWLKWDENTQSYQDAGNLKQFYGWITPDEENQKRRIHDPKHVPYLGVLIQSGRSDLISQFDQFEISIAEAWGRATAVPEIEDPLKVLKNASSAVKRLTIDSLTDNSAETVALLSALQANVGKLLKLIALSSEA